MKQTIEAQVSTIKEKTNGKRVLMACVAADGHFNPLSGLAKHLQQIGYDVRWYTGSNYAEKLAKLQIPHYTFTTAPNLTADNVNEFFPDRIKAKSLVAKLNFDLEHFFINRGPEYFEDLKNVYNSFPFDIVIADCTFTGIPFIVQKMNIPLIAIGIAPMMSSSKDLAPYGLGITPSYTAFGKLKQGALRWIANNILFKKSNNVLRRLCEKHQLEYNGQNVFDYAIDCADVLLQSGTPGFEYYRSDIPTKVQFVGPLLPFVTAASGKTWFDERLNKYSKVILVTQGTAEPDVTKLIKPTLEAFKGTDHLVVVATAGSCTEELRAQYDYYNVIIEDFIPFGEVMPYVDAYVTNGGYGGTLLGIQHELPLVVAGVHEGKSEICARVGYFDLGINLRTERPAPSQLKYAIERVLADAKYKQNVVKLAAEFRQYDPNVLTAQQVEKMTAEKLMQAAA